MALGLSGWHINISQFQIKFSLHAVCAVTYTWARHSLKTLACFTESLCTTKCKMACF